MWFHGQIIIDAQLLFLVTQDVVSRHVNYKQTDVGMSYVEDSNGTIKFNLNSLNIWMVVRTFIEFVALFFLPADNCTCLHCGRQCRQCYSSMGRKIAAVATHRFDLPYRCLRYFVLALNGSKIIKHKAHQSLFIYDLINFCLEQGSNGFRHDHTSKCKFIWPHIKHISKQTIKLGMRA